MDKLPGKTSDLSRESSNHPDSIEAIKEYLKINSDMASYEYAWRHTQKVVETNKYPVYKISILSSFTSRLLDSYLSTHLVLRGYSPKLSFLEYRQWYDELMNPGQLDKFEPDSIVLLLQLEDVLPTLGYNHLAEGQVVDEEERDFLAGLRVAVEQYRKRSTTPIVMSNFVAQGRGIERYFDWNTSQPKQQRIDNLNSKLSKLASEYGNVSVYDYSGIVTDIGRRNFFDKSKFFQTATLIKSAACPSFARDLVDYLYASRGKRKKAIVVDLDNTLWGGIVGEDGPDNVKTGGGYPGNGYWAFQTFMANLRSTGVILAISSKNNENDVLECFQFRKNDIALDLTQFSAREINWNDKSNSLRKIAADLNISMDSIIFCDDSPVECGLVASDCPEVTVIQLGSNPELFQDQIVDSGVFDSLKITDTDKARADFYSSEVTRRNYAAEVNDKETYLATLGMILTVSIPKEGQIERMVQLFMRTNQFNLTNRRYEYNDIVSMMDEGKEVVMFELVDRYGSYGEIGVFVMSTDNRVSTIDALVLSCRALGRGVESAILTVIEKKAIELRSNQLIGLYLSSKRNEIARDFYSSHGFLKENDKDKFVCTLGIDPKLSPPAYIQIQYGRNCPG